MPTYPSEAASEPRTQIASELDELESQISQADKLLIELSDRIHAATCQRAEDNAKNPAVPEPVRSPLGEAIHDQATRLRNINERMARLITSVDLPYSRELPSNKANMPTGTYNG